MLLAMVISFVKGGPSNILPVFSRVEGSSSTTNASTMFAGIVSVLVMTPFFYAGFDTIPQQAEEAAEGLDWNKFGKVISMALLAAGGFYMICIYSFGTIIPWTDFVKSSVPALACLKQINIILYVVMLIIATLGPMGPMNSFYGATSRIMLAMGRKGQLPESFAKLDEKSGAPRMANIVLAVLTLIGPFLGKKMLVSLTNVSALAFIFSCMMVSFACLKMRFTEPDLPRPYIDGTGAEPVQNGLVLVEDDKIVYAGPDREVGEDYEVIDITGKTIMPGLIDSHLHFSGNLTDDDSDWVLEDVVQKTVVAVQQAHECLENGLTTVGEISRSGIQIRDMVEAGVMKGPRVVATGLGFCRTAGHGDSHKLPSYYNNESHPWAERVDGPWDLRKAVRRRLRQSPDAIKIWSTGGGIWRWDQKLDQHYTLEEIQAVVDESNMVGIPVWSHAEGYGGALDSAKAGVHLIIHGQTLNDECLDIMAEKGIYFCPTIQFLNEWFKTYAPPYIPEVHDQYPGDTVAEKELNRVYANLRKAKEKGIGLTIGSDSFCSSLTPYGTTAIGEMYSFVEKAGISEMDTIVAATSVGAEMLKVDDVTGSLVEGKCADLLVINGNPLENIRAIAVENMDVIMKEGYFVKR